MLKSSRRFSGVSGAEGLMVYEVFIVVVKVAVSQGVYASFQHPAFKLLDSLHVHVFWAV